MTFIRVGSGTKKDPSTPVRKLKGSRSSSRKGCKRCGR